MRFARSIFGVAAIALLLLAVAVTPAFAAEDHAMWTRLLGTDRVDHVYGCAADSAGNVYVVGSTEGAMGAANLGSSDCFVQKRDHDGNVVWTDQFGTASQDVATCVMLSTTGDLYVGGYTYGVLPPATSNFGSTDAFVRKYTAASLGGTGGAPPAAAWTFPAGTGGTDIVTSIAQATGGGLWAVGYSDGDGSLPTAGGNDILIWRMTPGAVGSPWVYVGTAGEDKAFGVAANNFDQICVVGATNGTLGSANLGGYDAFSIVFDGSTGATQWTDQFGSSGTDHANAVADDTAGYFWIAGDTNGSLPDNANLGGADAFLREINPIPPTASSLFTRQFGTADLDVADCVAVEDGGRYVWVGGATGGSFPGHSNAGGRDAFVVKFLPMDSPPLKVDQFGTSIWDGLSGVAMSNGDLYAAGDTTATLDGQPGFGSIDGFVRRYDADTYDPVANVAAPAYSTQFSSTRTFWYSFWGADVPPAESGVAFLDVDRRTGASGTWVNVVTYAPATDSTVYDRGLYGTPGSTYYFRARAYDLAGNTGPWCASKCTVVPFDQRSMTFRGTWGTRRSSSLYLRSSRFATAKGASASIRFASARAVGLVCSTGKYGGMADVYIGRRFVRRINLYSSSAKVRRTFAIKNFSHATSGTLKVVALHRKISRSRGYRVELDGVGVRR